MKANRLLLYLNWFCESGSELVQSETTLRGGFVTFDPDQSTAHDVESIQGWSGLDEERDSCLVMVTCVVLIAWELFHIALNNLSLYFCCCFLYINEGLLD